MSPTRMSKVESAMRAALAFKEAFNQHDAAGMIQLVTDDCILENTHPAPDGEVYEGKDALAHFWQDLFHRSPHAHLEIEELFGFGDRCIMRWKYCWVDEGGKQEYIRGVDIIRVRDDAICEMLSYVKG